jgi:molybdenum cofactor cytidylyltransferase
VPEPFQSIAVIPAAGRSQRMGQPKLLLPWRGRPVIEHVLQAWNNSRVQHVVVTVHPRDLQLAELCRRHGARVVVPTQPPPDMKTSVYLALQEARRTLAPHEHDAWLLAPADMPRLHAAIVDRLLAAYQPGQLQIVAPVRSGRRGHPIVLPFALADEVGALQAHEGINALLERFPVAELECPDGLIHDDLDSPDDYRRLCSDPPQ